MTVRVLQLNAEGDPTGEPVKDFQFIEQAQAWCEKQRGAELVWVEEGRFFSLEGMTEGEFDALGDVGNYPPIRYWIFGVDEDGTDRELEDTDYEINK